MAASSSKVASGKSTLDPCLISFDCEMGYKPLTTNKQNIMANQEKVSNFIVMKFAKDAYFVGKLSEFNTEAEAFDFVNAINKCSDNIYGYQFKVFKLIEQEQPADNIQES